LFNGNGGLLEFTNGNPKYLGSLGGLGGSELPPPDHDG